MNVETCHFVLCEFNCNRCREHCCADDINEMSMAGCPYLTTEDIMVYAKEDEIKEAVMRFV